MNEIIFDNKLNIKITSSTYWGLSNISAKLKKSYVYNVQDIKEKVIQN